MIKQHLYARYFSDLHPTCISILLNKSYNKMRFSKVFFLGLTTSTTVIASPTQPVEHEEEVSTTIKLTTTSIHFVTSTPPAATQTAANNSDESSCGVCSHFSHVDPTAPHKMEKTCSSVAPSGLRLHQSLLGGTMPAPFPKKWRVLRFHGLVGKYHPKQVKIWSDDTESGILTSFDSLEPVAQRTWARS